MSGIERLAIEIVIQARKDLTSRKRGSDKESAKQFLADLLASRGLDPSRLAELVAR